MKKRECFNCGVEASLTKHHDPSFGVFCLCRSCHDLVHGTVEKDKLKNAKRRIQRAKRRIKRDLAIIEASKKRLEVT